MRIPSPRTPIAALAVGLTLLTGCGGGEDPEAAADETTSASPSVSESPTPTERTAPAADGVAEIRDVVAAVEEAGSLQVEVSSDGTTQTLDVALRGPSADFLMDSPDGAIAQVDGEGFIRAADGWERIDPAQEETAMFGALIQAMGLFADPRTILAGVDGAEKTEGQSDGTTYELTAGGETATLSVDADGLPTRLVMMQEGSEFVLAYSRWGQVKVAAPQVG
ncbi:hypothetical protein GCM10027425_05490 [Alteromonas gracilis]